MKRVVLVVALVAAVVVTIDAVGDLTQSRPEPRVEGTTTTITFTVDTRSFRQSDDVAAQALWSVCSTTVTGEFGAPERVGDSERWAATVSPALGETGRTKIVGCLEDLTIERVLGDVVDVTSSA
jgi:hypothetical protein